MELTRLMLGKDTGGHEAHTDTVSFSTYSGIKQSLISVLRARFRSISLIFYEIYDTFESGLLHLVLAYTFCTLTPIMYPKDCIMYFVFPISLQEYTLSSSSFIPRHSLDFIAVGCKNLKSVAAVRTRAYTGAASPCS